MKLKRWFFAAVVAAAATVMACVNPVEPPRVEVATGPAGIFLTPGNLTLGSPFTMVNRGSTVEFSAAVFPAGVSQDVVWELESEIEGVGLTEAGVLTIGAGVPIRTMVEVTATAYDTDVSATARLMVTAPPTALAAVTEVAIPGPEFGAPTALFPVPGQEEGWGFEGGALRINVAGTRAATNVPEVLGLVPFAAVNRGVAIRNNFVEIDLTEFFTFQPSDLEPWGGGFSRTGEDLIWTVTGEGDSVDLLGFPTKYGDDFNHLFGMWDAANNEWIGGEGVRRGHRHGEGRSPTELGGLVVRENRAGVGVVYFLRLPISEAANWTYVFFTNDEDAVFSLTVDVRNPLVREFAVYGLDPGGATVPLGAGARGEFVPGEGENEEPVYTKTVNVTRTSLTGAGHATQFAFLANLRAEDLEDATKVYTVRIDGDRTLTRTFHLVDGPGPAVDGALTGTGQDRVGVTQHNSATESRTEIRLLHGTPSLAGQTGPFEVDRVVLNVAGFVITINIVPTEAQLAARAIQGEPDVTVPITVTWEAASTSATITAVVLGQVQARVNAVLAELYADYEISATAIVTWDSGAPTVTNTGLPLAERTFNVAITAGTGDDATTAEISVGVDVRFLPIFPTTDPTHTLASSVIPGNIRFQLSQGISGNNVVLPLSPSNSSVAVVNNGINVTGRSADHNGLVITITDALTAGQIGSASFNPVANEYRILVAGRVIGDSPSGAQVTVNRTSYPWSSIGGSESLAVAAHSAFELTVPVPVNFHTGADGASAQNLRIQTNNVSGAATMSFRISYLVIEFIQVRPIPCNCTDWQCLDGPACACATGGGTCLNCECGPLSLESIRTGPGTNVLDLQSTSDFPNNVAIESHFENRTGTNSHGWMIDVEASSVAGQRIVTVTGFDFAGSHDTDQDGGWTPLTVLPSGIGSLLPGDVLHITGRLGINATASGLGQFGINVVGGTDRGNQAIMISDSNNLPTTFTRSLILTQAHIDNGLEIQSNLWGGAWNSTIRENFFISVDDFIIVRP